MVGATVGDGVGLAVGVAVGATVGALVGTKVGAGVGGRVGESVGTGEGVAARPPSGERPVPTIQPAARRAKVTRKAPIKTPNCFISDYPVSYSASEMIVEPPANPAALNVKRAVAPFWTSSLPVRTCRLAVPAALTMAVVSLLAP